MEKDGAPGQVAPVAAAEATHSEQLQHVRQPNITNIPSEDARLDPGRDESGRHMQTQQPAQDRRASHGMLDRSLQAQLGRQLRAIFSHVAEEPVPDRFIKLLEALEAKETRR
jgi:hypothetical protein